MLYMGMDNPVYDTCDKISLTIDFNTPVSDLAFSILGLDYWFPTESYGNIEGVTVYADGVPIAPDPGSYYLHDAVGIDSTNPNGFAGIADGGGDDLNIDVFLNGPVQSIHIEFYLTQSGGANPDFTKLGISDMCFITPLAPPIVADCPPAGLGLYEGYYIGESDWNLYGFSNGLTTSTSIVDLVAATGCNAFNHLATDYDRDRLLFTCAQDEFNNLYAVDVTTGTVTDLGELDPQDEFGSPDGGAVYYNGIYYIYVDEDNFGGQVDRGLYAVYFDANGDAGLVGKVINEPKNMTDLGDLAVDENGTLYLLENTSQSTFYTLDLDNIPGGWTLINSDAPQGQLFFDDYGRLIGGQPDGSIIQINTTNGTKVDSISNIGQQPADMAEGGSAHCASELPQNSTYAIDDENSTLQAMPVAGDVSTNDFDLEGDMQDFETFLNQDGSGTSIASGDTLSGVDTAGNVISNAGTLTFTTTGKYIFTPDSGFIGTVQIPYSICDDGIPKACDTAILTINVVPDDGNTTNTVVANNDENITWGDPVHGDVLVNDFDPELDSIIFDGFVDPVSGLNITNDTIFTIPGYDAANSPVSDVGDLIVYPDGSYTFIPIPNFTGYFQLPYDISDDGSPIAVDSAVLTIIIIDNTGPQGLTNNPPFAGDDHNSTIINTPVSGAWSGNDMEPNKDDITFNGQAPQMDLDTMAAPPGVSLGTYTTEQGGSIEFFTDGSYTYTPPTDYIGPDQISYEICDVTTVEPQPLCDSATVYLLIASPPCPNIEAWVYLEGSLVDANGLGIYTVPMRTTLNTGRVLPGQTFGDAFNPGEYQPRLGNSNQVYNIAPWSYAGTEGHAYDSYGVVADGDANYPATVTDWVLVSLRSDPGNPASTLCTHAALLHNDGRLEFPDATELCCDLDINASYWVVIEHHNHLIVMSDVAVPLTDGNITYDFRDRNAYLDDPFGSGYVAQKEVLSGVFAMYAGNGQQSSTPEEDTDLNTNDANQWDIDKNQFSVYLRGDYDMNGDVNTDDRNLWDKNKQTITSVPR